MKAFWLCTLGLLIVLLVLAGQRNDFFEFCTTRAYGLPLPWKIDYCECEGGQSHFEFFYMTVNLMGCVIGGYLLSLLVPSSPPR